MRTAIVLFFCLLIPIVSWARTNTPASVLRQQAGKPQEEQKQPQEEQNQQPQEEQKQRDLQGDAQAESRQYDAEVKKLAREIAAARAEKLAWLYFPAEVNWIGVGVFYGNDWQLRPSCEEGRACMPHMGITYGAEIFLNPLASLDLVGRIGGASQFTDGFNTRHGLDVSALARWRIVGVVPVLLGWRMIGTPYQQVGEDGKSVIDATTYSHYGYLGAGFRFRGATAEIGVNVGAHAILSIRTGDDAKNTFSAFATLRLITPALVGF